jgi:hypothetical protein
MDYIVTASPLHDGYPVIVSMKQDEPRRLTEWLRRLRDEVGCIDTFSVKPLSGELTFAQFVKAVEKYSGESPAGSMRRIRDLGTTLPRALEQMVAASFGATATGEQVQRVGEIVYELISEDGQSISGLTREELTSYINKANYAYGQELARKARSRR